MTEEVAHFSPAEFCATTEAGCVAGGKNLTGVEHEKSVRKMVWKWCSKFILWMEHLYYLFLNSRQFYLWF